MKVLLVFLTFGVSLVLGTTCYNCDHHPHHHHSNCRLTYCRSDEFCRTHIDHHGKVTGQCEHIHGYNYCLKDVSIWCHDYRLATYVGQCRYCCRDQFCINQALQLTSMTAPQVTITKAVTTTNAATSTQCPSTTNDCVDLSPDCATVKSACTDPFAHIVCKKFCNLCATTTTPPTVTTPTSSRSCYQCGNFTTFEECYDAQLALGRPEPCPSGSYCMTDVYNASNGKVLIFKRCVDRQTCETKWLQQTSKDQECLNYNPITRTPHLHCHFCCQGNNCNSNIVPEQNTFFKP